MRVNVGSAVLVGLEEAVAVALGVDELVAVAVGDAVAVDVAVALGVRVGETCTHCPSTHAPFGTKLPPSATQAVKVTGPMHCGGAPDC